MNAETIQLYLDLIKNVEILKNDILNDVSEANKAYYEAETQIIKEYADKYSSSIWDWDGKIPIYFVEKFRIEEIHEECYTVSCRASTIHEEEQEWIITIPFNMDELPHFVKEFKDAIEQGILKGISTQNQKQLEKDQKEFERLKTKLQENLGDKFSTIPLNQTTENKINLVITTDPDIKWTIE